MASGGARVNPGRAPDPNALRRDRGQGLDRDGWLTLPASGYDGPVPPWPLLPDILLRAKLDVTLARIERLEESEADAPPSKRSAIFRRLDEAREKAGVLSFQVAEQDGRERALWTELWRSPQAVAWAMKLGQGGFRDVAQYVRHKVLAELGSMEDAKEARQWSDRLGLNPSSMLRNRWRLAADQVGEKRASSPVTSVEAISVRDRLKAVSSNG